MLISAAGSSGFSRMGRACLGRKVLKPRSLALSPACLEAFALYKAQIKEANRSICGILGGDNLAER